jgi:hypothetical protein
MTIIIAEPRPPRVDPWTEWEVSMKVTRMGLVAMLPWAGVLMAQT